MSESDILRVNTFLNTTNDALIGQAGGSNGGPTLSGYAGQLGKWIDVDSDQIATMFDPSVGTLYGGRYQYVRLAAAAGVPVLGQILFWDTSVALNLFQVTTDEALSSVPDSLLAAGVNLNPSLTVGRYTFIQILGVVNTKFVASLTTSGAIGIPVYASAAGGSSVGLADVITTDATAVANAKYLGKAIDAPVGGAVSRVDIMPQARFF